MERRRRIATYLMLAGLLGAGLILLIGFWNYSRATQGIDVLVKDCETLRRRWPALARHSGLGLEAEKVPVLSCERDDLETWEAEKDDSESQMKN